MNGEPDRSFIEAVEPLRGALRLHCYRMLGSSHDGEDVVQETMLRAWRAKDTLKDEKLLRPWLYRIATNVCLDELKSRPRRSLASDTYPPQADPTGPISSPVEEPVWLEPMPGTWLAAAGAPDPSARYTLKESVALAFVAALQILTPSQRATLLLRDVVGLSAEETAEALGLSVSAANSALFRARTAVEEKLGGKDASAKAPLAAEVDESLLAQYVRAFEESNVDALVALLHDDVQTTMPPSPTWMRGREANEAFYRHMLSRVRGMYRILRTEANGQPALGFYRAAAPGEPRLLHAIQLVETRDGRIARIDHFMTAPVFPLFGLPEAIPWR
jgi:RNA polymerase sigma-70 factor (ECF subfamily)